MEDDLEYRVESDTMGTIRVPKDAYWGAQTERSFENFKIGKNKMPMELIYALAIVKKSAAKVNVNLGLLDRRKGNLIEEVCEEIISGKLDDHFPLVIYQTGSGTQTNMNINEVISNRGNQLAGEKLLHPNDDVNMGQSSNDAFPTAMHIAALTLVEDRLIPAMNSLIRTLSKLQREYRHIVTVGRTHLQDATPLTLGQEISGWKTMIEASKSMIVTGIKPLRQLALGGTAVGTGLNCHQDFGKLVALEISKATGKKFVTASNKFYALSSRDGLSSSHGNIKSLATDLMKIANDIRWLSSGPRCGIGELIIPANEPGSSIMPGKVNPTQCEAVTMVVARVMGNDCTVGIGNSQGNFQLNAYMPIIIATYIESVSLLADAMNSFNKNCIRGLKPNKAVIKENLKRSLMLVTALNPHIGYDRATRIAKYAYEKDVSLKEAALALGAISEQEFDSWVKPEEMIHPIEN